MFNVLRSFPGIAFCAVVLLSGLAEGADEMVANPLYDSWAKAAVGTVVKYSQSTEMMGSKTTLDMTETLKEVTPEAARVVIGFSKTMAGNKTDLPTKVLSLKAKVLKSSTVGSATTMPAEGQEDVTVNGKTYSCKISSTTVEKKGMKVHAKVWSCAEVPGGIVKMESTIEGAMKTSSTMTLISVTAK